jgi:hypothetical protein
MVFFETFGRECRRHFLRAVASKKNCKQLYQRNIEIKHFKDISTLKHAQLRESIF